ncbi:TPA: hypothetical protein ACONGY_002703, partial [Staphylococcus aureus]
SAEKSKKLDEFKTKVKENRLISPNINDISELKSKVSQTLMQSVPSEIKENSGWIRVQDCGKKCKKIKKIGCYTKRFRYI